MAVHLDEHFTYKKIGKAVLSPILMMVFTSVYSIVDGVFVSNFVGKTAFAALNLVFPATMILGSLGFMMGAGGAALVASYNYGAQNRDELKNMFRKSTIINIVAGVIMTVLSVSLARPLSSIFVSYDANLLDMTTFGMRIFSVSFMFMGFNMFTSSFFTALNNGLISAIVSFARTLIFQIAAVMLLPMAFGLTGIWVSVIVAEFLSLVLEIIFLVANQKKYGY